MPERNVKTTVARRQKGAFDDLKEFIGVCAQVKKAASPDAIRANVGRFVNELPQDSKDFLVDLVGMFRRPR